MRYPVIPSLIKYHLCEGKELCSGGKSRRMKFEFSIYDKISLISCADSALCFVDRPTAGRNFTVRMIDKLSAIFKKQF